MMCYGLQDVLTDLKADAETLPLEPVREDWVGHKVNILLCSVTGSPNYALTQLNTCIRGKVRQRREVII